MPTIDEGSRLLSGAAGGFLRVRNTRKTAANANHEIITTRKAWVGQKSKSKFMIGLTLSQLGVAVTLNFSSSFLLRLPIVIPWIGDKTALSI